MTIHRIAVDVRLRNQGIGLFMLKKAEEMCKEKKIASIRADTWDSNYPMKHFLLSNRFQLCGRIDAHGDNVPAF